MGKGVRRGELNWSQREQRNGMEGTRRRNFLLIAVVNHVTFDCFALLSARAGESLLAKRRSKDTASVADIESPLLHWNIIPRILDIFLETISKVSIFHNSFQITVLSCYAVMLGKSQAGMFRSHTALLLHRNVIGNTNNESEGNTYCIVNVAMKESGKRVKEVS